MGYGRPEAEVWMSKVIQRTRKLQGATRPSTKAAANGKSAASKSAGPPAQREI